MVGKSPTLHEVADRAGVSIATVSRVARGFGQVSPATRGKVLEVIEELNYRPSHFGRALVKRRHGALGLVFPGIRGPYYSEVIHGFEVESVAARMSLMILGTDTATSSSSATSSALLTRPIAGADSSRHTGTPDCGRRTNRSPSATSRPPASSPRTKFSTAHRGRRRLSAATTSWRSAHSPPRRRVAFAYPMTWRSPAGTISRSPGSQRRR